MAEQKTNPLTMLSDTSFSPEKVISDIDSSLQLLTRQGQSVELNHSTLDYWFATFEKSHEEQKNTFDDEYYASQLIGRFGLKSSKDVIAFLKTPTGDAIKHMLREELAEMASLEKERLQDLHDKERRHYRFIVFYLLGLLHKKSVHARHLNELMQKQNEQRLSKNTTHELPRAITHPVSHHQTLQKAWRHYERSANALTKTIHRKEQELETVESELAILAEEARHLERYALFHASMQEIYQFTLNNQLLFKQSEHLENAAALVMQQIQQIQQAIEAENLFVNELIINSAKNILEQTFEQQNRFHQLQAFQDILDVVQGNKRFVDLNGNDTRSFKKAAFTLKMDQKIVKGENGNYCLIPMGDDLNTMSNSAKEAAQKRFERQQTDISTASHLIHRYEKAERKAYQERSEAAEKRGVNPAYAKQLRDEVSLLQNQLAGLRATQASVAREMQKEDPDVGKAESIQDSAPKLTPGTSKAPLRETEAYKKTLEVLSNKTLSAANITSLRDAYIAFCTPSSTDPTLLAINRLTPGQPIPPETMKFLLRSVNSRGLSSDKFNPEILPSLQSTEALKTPENKSTAPSPFDLTPYRK